MHYFQAQRHLKKFETFYKLASEYWESLPEQHPSDMVRFTYQENSASSALRAQIAAILPHVEMAASELGVGYILTSYPPAAVGGPVVPINIFHSVINPQIGWDILDRRYITDTLHKAMSVAREARRRSLIHALLPWNWVIDVCALIVRIPFLILRRAGVPPQVEENIIAHLVKVVATIALISWLAYQGVSIADMPKLLGNSGQVNVPDIID
jgi:hypothetical protein